MIPPSKLVPPEPTGAVGDVDVIAGADCDKPVDVIEAGVPPGVTILGVIYPVVAVLNFVLYAEIEA